MPRSLIEVAHEFVRAFNEGDLAAFEAVLDPEVELHSMRGLRQGREAAVSWATRAPGGVQQTIEVLESRERDDEVLLTVDRHWHWAEDGSHASTDEIAWLFDFRDGMVSSWRPFEDRELAELEFGGQGDSNAGST